MRRNVLAFLTAIENRLLSGRLTGGTADPDGAGNQPARVALRLPLLLVIVAILMFTVFTAVSHAGTCSTLTGFPGLLQRAGLVAAGPCVSTDKDKGCTSAACTTTDRKPGKCTNIAWRGPANCVCVASTISKTLQ
jgi:hypothetical protein